MWGFAVQQVHQATRSAHCSRSSQTQGNVIKKINFAFSCLWFSVCDSSHVLANTACFQCLLLLKVNTFNTEPFTTARPIFVFLCLRNFAQPQNHKSMFDSECPPRWTLQWFIWTASTYSFKDQLLLLWPISGCLYCIASRFITSSVLQYPPYFILFSYPTISPPPSAPPLPVNIMFSHFLFPHPLHFVHHSPRFLPPHFPS